jgi:hypothetical protein
MKLKALHKKSLSSDDQSYEVYSKFQNLIQILHKKDLPSNLITDINTDIEAINTSSNSGKSLKKLIHNKQSSIVKLIEKEVKLVPKNHYKTLWLAIGMSAIGIPIGVVIGMSTGNMAFLGIGLPIGLGIGVAIGTQMDKKAMEEGRQLNIEL